MEINHWDIFLHFKCEHFLFVFIVKQQKQVRGFYKKKVRGFYKKQVRGFYKKKFADFTKKSSRILQKKSSRILQKKFADVQIFMNFVGG